MSAYRQERASLGCGAATGGWSDLIIDSLDPLLSLVASTQRYRYLAEFAGEPSLILDFHKTFYAALVTAKGGVKDDSIKAAFAKADRAKFVGKGPWKIFTPVGYIETPSSDPEFLYQDIVVALSPERKINNGEPSLHARCISAVSPTPGESVLHVGAGTGYYTSILASLVGPTGSIVAYEIETDLATQTAANLVGHQNVNVRARSAIELNLPDSDVLYVNAGATYPPAEWLDALNPGGRMIFPLTAAHSRSLRWTDADGHAH